MLEEEACIDLHSFPSNVMQPDMSGFRKKCRNLMGRDQSGPRANKDCAL